jgi:Na+/H+-translocating membrane pyrophosphatase
MQLYNQNVNHENKTRTLEGIGLVVRMIAKIGLALGVNLNWLFAPMTWLAIKRAAPKSLHERRQEALRHLPRG